MTHVKRQRSGFYAVDGVMRFFKNEIIQQKIKIKFLISDRMIIKMYNFKVVNIKFNEIYTSCVNIERSSESKNIIPLYAFCLFLMD